MDESQNQVNSLCGELHELGFKRDARNLSMAYKHAPNEEERERVLKTLVQSVERAREIYQERSKHVLGVAISMVLMVGENMKVMFRASQEASASNALDHLLEVSQWEMVRGKITSDLADPTNAVASEMLLSVLNVRESKASVLAAISSARAGGLSYDQYMEQAIHPMMKTLVEKAKEGEIELPDTVVEIIRGEGIDVDAGP